MRDGVRLQSTDWMTVLVTASAWGMLADLFSNRLFARILMASFAALFLFGCAGYAARTETARTALDYGSPEQALAALNDELDVDSESQLPAKLDDEEVLLALERGTVLQQLGRHKFSSRDLEAADKEIEVLDFSRRGVHEVGRYLFSDDVGPYRAPPYEKLMINTLNMVNYLVRGDLAGARVEARRFTVMQKFIDEHESHRESLSGIGSYLAGFIFEMSERYGEAVRYYKEAQEAGTFSTLEEPVKRLSESPSRECDKNGPDACATVLVVFNYGRVPVKRARRIPIGLALTYASTFISPDQAERAAYLAGQGLVTWINYPELGRPRATYDAGRLWVDGQTQTLEEALAVDAEAIQAWRKARGAVVASAIVRMLARVAAGQVGRRAVGGGIAGALLSLGSQAALTARDTPDTRSWSTLPARIQVARLRLPPGTHRLRGRARGIERSVEIRVTSGDWKVVSFSALR